MRALWFCLISTILRPTAFAEDQSNQNPGVSCTGSYCYDQKKGDYTKNKGAYCDDLLSKVKDAQKEVNTACSDAGILSKCKDQIARCVGEASKEAGTSRGTDLNSLFAAIAPALGLPASSSTNTKISKKCPSQNAKDYFDSKKAINDEIKDLQNEITDLSKEIADEKEALDKQMKDTQKEIAEAQKAFNKSKRDLKAESRTRVSDQLKAQADATDGLRKAEAALLGKRQEMARYDENYLLELAQFSDELAKLSCMESIQKKRGELNQMMPANNNAGFLQGAKQKTEALKKMWNICVSGVQQQRVNKMNERKRFMEKALVEIDQLQGQIDEANNALQTYNSQMTESLKDIDTQISEGENELFQQMQQAQSALTAAQQTTNQKQQALLVKQQVAQARIATLQQDLTNLGAEPTSGATKSWREAQSSFFTFLDEADPYIANCCISNTGGHTKDPTICGTNTSETRRKLETGKK